MAVFLALLIHINILHLIAHTQPSPSLNTWTLSPITLPQLDSKFVCEYDSLSNSIFILGGQTNPYSFYQWNLTDNQFIIHPSLNITVTQSSTHYANFIYIVSNHLIGTLNMNTSTMEYPITSKQTISWGKRLCIAISNDGQYLFFTGGSSTDSSNDKHNQFEIYDILNDQFIAGPPMPEIRANHACIVDNNNYLYVMGGDIGNSEYDSITRIYTGNISDIHLESWNDINDTMNEAKNYLKTVIMNDDIYIIGGDAINSVETNTVEVIYNTDRNTIYLDNNLSFPRSRGCVVNTELNIYYLGGNNENGSNVDDILVNSFPTANPTTNPTITPSKNPTIYPTINPTINPS
eukprot:489728_1